MEVTNYTSIGPVLQLNKAGELTQKRMKAVKVCDGLYITEPNKRDFVRYIIECNGVMWVESTKSKSYVERYAAMMPEVLKKVKAGFYNDAKWNNYCREIDRRINHPEAPAIMELKKPERKKVELLAENERKVSVLMFKGCTEVCTKAYEHARDNIADGAASGMAYFIEVQKRIDTATPTETPQISTEAAETVNVSAEGEKGAETRENTPKRKIQYFHYTPEQLKRYIIDVYEKNANGEWVLLPYKQIDTDKCFWNVINGKIGEWDRMQERFTEVNMDFNSPTCGRCFKINRTYQQDYFIVSNEKLLEFTINGNYYYIQKQTYSKGKHRWCYTIMDAYGDFAVDDFSYTKRGIMQRFNKWWKKNATIIWQASETPTEPPQSPETPQTVECATDTPKPRETAEKRQNRAIGSAQHRQHSALGANGYAVLNDASATLTTMHVPRECSTADAAYW